MAQEQYLSKLESLCVGVAWANMEAFVDMLKTRWAWTVVQQQQQPGASAYMIRSGTIRVFGADDESISLLSSRILQVQGELGVLASLGREIGTRLEISRKGNGGPVPGIRIRMRRVLGGSGRDSQEGREVHGEAHVSGGTAI